MKISVIIPVKNGASTLKQCLQKLQAQTIIKQLEIIILDSMSTDSSRIIAAEYGAQIIEIPTGTFNHGLTRNLGVQHAKGELLYFTVQDAFLAEDDQLEKMAEHFEDHEVQSVTGIQGIPSEPDKNPAIWFRRITKPNLEVRHFNHKAFTALTIKEQIENSNWDNVNSMYRKSALQSLPFQETDFAEDILWAIGALKREWKIIRDSSLLVYHYHHQTISYSFKSSYIFNYTFWKNFKAIPSFPRLVKPFAENVYTLSKRNQIAFPQKIQWMIHNVLRHFANFTAVIVFRIILLFGNKFLFKSYRYFCSTIPQGRQKKLK